ncbi:MAG TPA: ATP-binding protein, partial [Chthonomonadaceae bacterium]|nr:ATP-binding protein [Chthonomonadaceae bacterium]
VVNELISNAVKHGRGEISVGLAVHDGAAKLEVCDAGPGFGEAFDPGESTTTGLELVQALVQMDLQGQTSFENRLEGGARVLVTFPVPVRAA